MADAPTAPLTLSRLRGEPASMSTGDVALGASIGRYVVVGRLGAGGGGTVYAVYDPKLGRRVALKVITADDRDAALDEARLLAALDHQNVARVHDVGRTGARGFMTMELVEGHDLATTMRAPTSTLRARLRLLLLAGRGLQAAHDAGIVHGDFKPGNVLVSHDHARVRLVDFGLGRVRGAAGHASAEASADGPISAPLGVSTPMHLRSGPVSATSTAPRSSATWGTPAYAAPELFEGRRPDVGADIYAYCVSLFEAIFGRLPHDASSAQSLYELKLADVALPSSPAVHRALARLVRAGLSPDRRDRPSRMLPILAALERVTTPSRRWRVAVPVAGLAVAASTIAIGLGSQTPCRGLEHHFNGVWDDGVRAQTRDAVLATGVPFAASAWENTEGALDAYASGWLEVRTAACEGARADASAVALLDRKMACLDRRLAEFRGLVDGLRRADADGVARAHRAAAGLSPFASCADDEYLMRDASVAADDADTGTVREIEAQLAHANALRALGQYGEALRLARDSLARAESTGHAPTIASALRMVGRLDVANGETVGGIEKVEAAARMAEVEGADETAANAWLDAMFLRSAYLTDSAGALRLAPHVDTALARAKATVRARAEYQETLAEALRDQGRIPEAANAMKTAIAYAEQSGDDPLVRANLSEMRANLFEMQGNVPASVQAREETLAVLTELYGAHHPQAIVAMVQLADAVDLAGDTTRAIQLYDEAIPRAQEALGPDHPQTLMMLANFGGTVASADPERSVTIYGDARQRFERAGMTSHPAYPSVVSNLAASLGRAGRPAEAATLAAEVLPTLKEALGDDHPWVTATMQTLGAARYDAGDIEGSVSALRDALAGYEKIGSPQPTTAEVRDLLARSLRALQRDPEAD